MMRIFLKPHFLLLIIFLLFMSLSCVSANNDTSDMATFSDLQNQIDNVEVGIIPLQKLKLINHYLLKVMAII